MGRSVNQTGIIAELWRSDAGILLVKPAQVDAAFQFPLHHPSVVSIIPGGQGVAEMESNFAAAAAEIPVGLWRTLKAEGLLRKEAPTP